MALSGTPIAMVNKLNDIIIPKVRWQNQVIFTLFKVTEILMWPKNPTGEETLVQDVGGKCQYSKQVSGWIE